ncbi:MAG: hypothetical protein WC494_03500 [Candidatus Pacearchaeota archaeon]
MRKIMFAFVVFILVGLGSAQYSIDISGLKAGDYSLGEEVSFKVILLEGEKFVDGVVSLVVQDALKKKEILINATANKETKFLVESDFPSGIWSITASYSDVEVERNFLVGENSEVEFKIEGDELIIRNIGNVRYTKTLKIKIGSNENTYVQNIGVGEEKVLKLVSPEGTYNIEVTDGKTTLRRENVQLYGSGNVVGAVNKELVGYTGLAGVGGLEDEEDERFLSLDKLPLALIFVGAVGVLAVLIIFERKLAKKSKRKR